MRVLLDTHILLWSLWQPTRLTKAVADLLINPENDILFSAVSIWEIAIKAGLHRSDFDADPVKTGAAAIGTGFLELPLVSATAARVATLPRHHADPFDRLLVAQALAEPATLITADRALVPYSDLITTFDPLPG